MRVRRGRGLVALAARRLRVSAGGRFAAVAAIPVALAFAGIAVALRTVDGSLSPLEGLVPTAATWLAWACAAPIALSAARDRRLLDRREGVDALAAARGFSASALESARALGAMVAITTALGVPLVVLTLFTVTLAGSFRLALARVALALLAAAFSLIVGVTLGGLASICARAGRARGRLLLVALVAGPWVLADLLGHGAWSIPGALAAVIDFTLRAGQAST
jgi:hypothetical protein